MGHDNELNKAKDNNQKQSHDPIKFIIIYIILYIQCIYIYILDITNEKSSTCLVRVAAGPEFPRSDYLVWRVSFGDRVSVVSSYYPDAPLIIIPLASNMWTP